MMEILLEKTEKLLKVIFSDPEDIEKHFESKIFKRRYLCSWGVTFTFEKSEKGLFLSVSFDRYKDPEVIYKITIGQSVEELQVLWELAHLPCAIINCLNVLLLDGSKVELIHTVLFELRKVGDGVWETGGNEPEAYQRYRQMSLNRMKDGVPVVYSEKIPEAVVANQAESARGEVIFADEAMEEGGPGTHAPQPSEDRDPNKIAECDGCENLFYENELTEIKPELRLCQFCRIDPGVAQKFGLTPDELPGLGNKTCDGCGILLTKDELTEAEPGRWLCDGCMLHYVRL